MRELLMLRCHLPSTSVLVRAQMAPFYNHLYHRLSLTKRNGICSFSKSSETRTSQVQGKANGKIGNLDWHLSSSSYVQSIPNHEASSRFFLAAGRYCEKSLSEFGTMRSRHFLLPSSFNKSVSILNFHTSGTTQVKYEISHNNGYLDIRSATSAFKIPFIWLRDHCRCAACYNHSTHQKNVDPDLLKRDLIPAAVTYSADKPSIIIRWKDDHVSEFGLEFLESNFYPGKFYKKMQAFLWDKDIIQSEQLPVVSHSDHVTTESGLKQSLSNLVKYGFTFVEGSPVSVEGTRSVVERIAFVLETLFGGMWSFTSNAARSDTAYSTLYLGAHTDTTYLQNPAGIQVFQCLEHNGSGGETMLVDGFNAMETLRASDPVAFELLSRTVVPHEYKETPGKNSIGHHTYSLGPVITTHPASGELLQLRFNPYDRAPLNTVHPDNIVSFYEAYDKLASIIAKKSNEFWIKLKPGTVLFIDNWRVMHGRAAFDGKRVMCGCYLPRDDWISRARILGVL